ncbi:DUF3108 domain-containing protein [Rhizosphaericola mali]|uniref:DUF3108 domain-containing protein n=1 Tax=Rhizosphaericola mali TaxID=2545455 RepID=A0A5P2G1V5_9BACT|nr:hypothetical protein [Rhizosphaericola mali]QES89435.1 hypothetical protein E0W69_012425 [Rhizosphaericola mali]
MKYYLILPLCLGVLMAHAQKTIVPNKKILGSDNLKNRQFDLDWNAIVGENKMNIGTVHINMLKNKDQFTVITTTKIAKFPDKPWIDSSICAIPSLTPIYHSSYNMQRDMVLHFGETISGYYLDKQKDSLTHISDTITSPYFDSNIYQWLICLLPLQEGMNVNLPLYDYNPSKSGLMNATITQIVKGEYISPVSGSHKVWIVHTEDDLSGSTNKLVFYIDQKEHTLWKMEATVGNRKIEQVLHEK